MKDSIKKQNDESRELADEMARRVLLFNYISHMP